MHTCAGEHIKHGRRENELAMHVVSLSKLDYDEVSSQLKAVCALRVGERQVVMSGGRGSHTLLGRSAAKRLTQDERDELAKGVGSLRSIRDPLQPSPLSRPFTKELCSAIDPSIRPRQVLGRY